MVTAWPTPLRQQVQALLDQFLIDPPALIGTSSIEMLARTTKLYSARIETLAGFLPATAFVWVQGTSPQLWVSPSSDVDYRTVFDRFARERLGMAGRPDGSAFNIDHLFPQTAGVIDGMSHVRAMAIDAAANQSAGRTVEKVMAVRARDVPSGKLLHSATWVTIGKAIGFPSWRQLPGGPDASEKNARLVDTLFDFLAARGVVPPAGNLERKLSAYSIARQR